MQIASMGDLALAFQLRRDNARLSGDLVRAASEVTTGRVQDINERVGGDHSGVSAIEVSLSRLSSYAVAATEAGLEADAREYAISTVRDIATGVVSTLLVLDGASSSYQIGIAAREAGSRFQSVINALNAQTGGRSLFAGARTDAPALADAETMLIELEGLITSAGATTAVDIIAIADAWFGPGGGFESVGYIGGMSSIPATRLGESETLSSPPRADDQRLRDALKAFALASLAERNTAGVSDNVRADLLRSAGDHLLQGDRDLVDLQAEIGTSQFRIATTKTRNAAQTATLELARNNLLAVDPFEGATRLASLETQLQTLYSVTSRLSRFSLTDYLR